MKCCRHVARLPLFDNIWIEGKDGDTSCVLLFGQHSSKYHYKDGQKPTRFVGPGERIVLSLSVGVSHQPKH